MVEEIIERLPGLSGGEMDRLEAGIQAERLRRGGVPDGASSNAAYELARRTAERGATLPEVL